MKQPGQNTIYEEKQSGRNKILRHKTAKTELKLQCETAGTDFFCEPAETEQYLRYETAKFKFKMLKS